jgi:hypothetical protein
VISRIRDRFQFGLERILVRGAFWRLLVVMALIALISIVGGLLVAGTGQFEDPLSAIWWAFLRLSDPGYLGDDSGYYVRTISTILTVAGYVVFLGGMVAIMTQALNQALRNLEAGLTPIAGRDHFVVMGWTTRTPTIVKELLGSEDRVQLFFSLRARGKLNVVVMADEVDATLAQDLRDRVGEAYSSRSVILRSGTPLRIEHLQRVAALDAASVLLPAADVSPSTAANPDTYAIKTLLSLASFVGDRDYASAPLVVAEILDARKMITARRAYPGPLELVATNQLISRLVAQNIRHPGLADVYASLLAMGEGSEIYARECPQFAGLNVGQLADAFPTAILIGIVRREGDHLQPVLNPSDDLALRADDRLVLVAEDYAQTAPPADFKPMHTDRAHDPPAPPELEKTRKVLVLGWNHHVPALLAELEACRSEQFEIVIASMLPVVDRQRRMENNEVVVSRCQVEHHELDYTIPGQLRRLDPARFDNVVMVANDWLESEEGDARTILGHLLLREIVPEGPESPDVLVELNDPGNLALFQRGASEVLIAPMILSHIMAQVALRRELGVVFDELFASEGVEMFFRDATSYGLVGKEARFNDIQRAAAARNETALGLRRRQSKSTTDGELLINPPRTESFTIGEHDQVVVLATYG